MHFRAPRDYNNWKDSLGRLSHHRYYTDNRMKHTFRLYVKKKKKKFIYLSWNFNLNNRIQVCHTSGGYLSALREGRQGDTILGPSLDLITADWYLPERSLHTHLKR